MNLILDMIDKMNAVSQSGILSAFAGEESGQQWEEVSNYLFQLLGKFTYQIHFTGTSAIGFILASISIIIVFQLQLSEAIIQTVRSLPRLKD